MKSFSFKLLFLSLLASSSLAFSQDVTNLGGDMTSSFNDRAAIQVTAPNISSEERRVTQLEGFSTFHDIRTKEEGLGPRFLNASCGGCHVNNGKGLLKFSSSFDVGTTMVVKISLSGKTSTGASRHVPGLGSQFLDHHVDKDSKDTVSLTWEYLKGTYPDRSAYTLRRPKIRLNTRNPYKDKIITSLRMTPPVIGPGLLEAISEADIIAMSDPSDANQDGISGRPNYVHDIRSNSFKIGRFGFKASHPTLEQQSAAAFNFDMGLKTSLFKAANGAIEISDQDLNFITEYQRLAGVPMARNQSDPGVILGKNLFKEIGCDSCHKMTLTTPNIPGVPEVSNQEIHPFTDLLLHDMGPGLADKHSEFSARGSEWRTTPLWGLEFVRQLPNIRVSYLHDGRARSIEEAILWHGGEASAAKDRFKKLPIYERLELLAFLKSL